jgi:release factor glutamine methyltransferase
MTTRKALLAEAVATLRAAGVDGAERDARVLMRWASGLSAASFGASLDATPDAAERARIAAAVAGRVARRPVAQIIGEREFWGRTFRITDAVLDPRPETETLIEAALRGPAPARILDLGVGSGCILLTLLAEWPGATGLGVDASAAALQVAAENARRLGLAGRAELRLGDWLEGVKGRFDLIAANPPYIPGLEIAGLQPEVRDWEPQMALTPGGDGLDAYRAIAPLLCAALSPGGRALLEFGAGQETAVREIFEAHGAEFVRLFTDLSGRPRCIKFSNTEKS